MVPAFVTGKDFEDLLPGPDCVEAALSVGQRNLCVPLAMDEQEWAFYLLHRPSRRKPSSALSAASRLEVPVIHRMWSVGVGMATEPPLLSNSKRRFQIA
jgi:hypothetical protein